MENFPSSVNTEEDSTKRWSGTYHPPEIPAAYGLGLCGDEVIRPEQQRELDRDAEMIVNSRRQAITRARDISLD